MQLLSFRAACTSSAIARLHYFNGKFYNSSKVTFEQQSTSGMCIYVCGNPQLEAMGHTRTCLQPESGAWYYAQSAALSSKKEITSKDGFTSPSGQCVKGPSPTKPLDSRRFFGAMTPVNQ